MKEHVLRSKLIIGSILLVLVGIVAFVFLVTAEKDFKYTPQGPDGEGRPTALATPLPPQEPITDPVYSIPTEGAGVRGEENPVAAVDSAYFLKVYLPFTDELNISAGNGFALEALEVEPSSDFTAVAYPKGASKTDPRTADLGKGKADATGTLKMDAAIPTNLSLGSYTLEVSNGSKTFTTPFVIRPPLH